MSSDLLQNLKVVKGLAPAADRYNTDPVGDYVKMKLHDFFMGVVHQEGGTTGKATITVLAADDASGTNAAAIAFKYSVGGSGYGANGDAQGTLTQATTAGFDTTAATERTYKIYVKSSDLPANQPWIAIQLTEASNDPVNGSMIYLLGESRYGGASQPTDIA